MKALIKVKWIFIMMLVLSMVVFTSCKAKEEEPENTETPNTDETSLVEDQVDEAMEVEEEWVAYKNSNYGFGVKSPREWGEPIESDSGDGASLLENENFDVRVYASYLLEEMELESHINTYYQGWEGLTVELEGAKNAFQLEFNGADAYHKVVVAMTNDKIYTLLAIRKLPLESMSEEEKVSYDENVAFIEQVIESFVIFE